MMKKLLSAILLAFAVVSADAQFLFRISGNGLENPSYMLGTIHSLSSSLLDSIPEYLEAEQQCRQMYVEHKPQTTKDADNGSLKSLSRHATIGGRAITKVSQVPISKK